MLLEWGVWAVVSTWGRHILSIASGLTTTPRSLMRGQDRPPAWLSRWFWVSWFSMPSITLALISSCGEHGLRGMISSELEIPLLTLLSPFHGIVVRTWRILSGSQHKIHGETSLSGITGGAGLTAEGAVTTEELQLSHAQFQDWISLTVARKETKRRQFSFVF